MFTTPIARSHLLLVTVLLALTPAHADEPSRNDVNEEIKLLKQQIQQLDQKIRALENKNEVAREPAEKKKTEAPRLIADADKGFAIVSADEAFQIRFRGLIQADSRTFFNDSATIGNDSFLLRRARPIIEGRVYKDFEFMFVPEFGGSSVAIQDAYLNYRYAPWLQLRAGKYKAPVGLELLQSDSYTFFNERALPSNLVPNRDIGFMLHGETLEGALTYAAGVFNGVGDGRSTSNADFDDDREFAGRLFAFPFKGTGINELKGVGLGLGGSFGDETGATALPGGYLTDGQQSFFTYRSGAGTAASPNVVADGKHWRLAPQAYNYWGPIGLLGEYTFSSQYVRRDAGATVSRVTLDHTAWQIAGSWVITGENASFTGIKPRHDFNPGAGEWGAFEFVARYAELHLDSGAFPLYANANSARSAGSFGVGLNWYLNRFVRLGVDFTETNFSGGDGTLNVVRHGENVLLTRLQLAF